RGYLLIRDSRFLRPYEDSKHTGDSLFRDLQKETLDDTILWNDLNMLESLTDKNYQLAEITIHNEDPYLLQLTDTQRIKTFFREEIMDRIRSLVKNMQGIEQYRLKERLDEMTTRYNVLNAI